MGRERRKRGARKVGVCCVRSCTWREDENLRDGLFRTLGDRCSELMKRSVKRGRTKKERRKKGSRVGYGQPDVQCLLRSSIAGREDNSQLDHIASRVIILSPEKIHSRRALPSFPPTLESSSDAKGHHIFLFLVTEGPASTTQSLSSLLSTSILGERGAYKIRREARSALPSRSTRRKEEPRAHFLFPLRLRSRRRAHRPEKRRRRAWLSYRWRW